MEREGLVAVTIGSSVLDVERHIIDVKVRAWKTVDGKVLVEHVVDVPRPSSGVRFQSHSLGTSPLLDTEFTDRRGDNTCRWIN